MKKNSVTFLFFWVRFCNIVKSTTFFGFLKPRKHLLELSLYCHFFYMKKTSSITVLEISASFRDGTHLVGGSMLKCQCGWYGRLKACPELQIKNYSGGPVKQQFLCRNCLH